MSFYFKSLLTIAALLVGIDASAYDFESDGLRYEILSETDKTVKVTNEGMDDFYNEIYEVVIPENIGDGAFYNWCDLLFVDIANTVTEIGTNAFGNCSMLRTLDFGNSLTTINDYAFEACLVERLYMVVRRMQEPESDKRGRGQS